MKENAIRLLRRLQEPEAWEPKITDAAYTALQMAIDALNDIPSAQPEQHGRIFKGIVVEYPSYNTYPEYKGKPYFSIKYTENGQEFIGYGTYKPEVLSEYLKEYFMPSAQLEWNNHTVACLLAELFNDTCACNFSGIDEWLPSKCELLDSCPHPVGVACWEQFLKHRADMRGADDE